MATQPENPGVEGTSDSVELRLYRVKAGCTVVFRALMDDIGGLNTHWMTRKSVYCHPEHCAPRCKAKIAYWKGYTGGQVYVPERKVWYPVVLELTEQCDLDMRPKYGRGTVWKLSRAISHRGKKSSVKAELVDHYPVEDLPPSFDIYATLMHVYHAQEIFLDVPNPLPPRPLAQLSAEVLKVAEEGSQELKTDTGHPTFKEMLDQEKQKLSSQTEMK